jgi:formate hydrogenlyase transcriptional activator
MTFPNPGSCKVVIGRCLPLRAETPDFLKRRGLLLILLLIATPFLCPISAAAQPTTKKVLILTGTDPNHPGFTSITQALRTILRNSSTTRVEFLYELQAGFSAQVSPEDDQHLIAYLKQKYQNQRIDLIYSMAAPRLRFLLQNEPHLFADVPKVFYEFDFEREPTLRSFGAHATGVWAKVELSRTLDLALNLHPDTQRVIVIAGNSETERAVMEQAKQELRPYESRLAFTYLTNVTLDELRGQLATLPKQCVVMYLIFHSDRAGNVYPGPEALSIVAPTSSAPIYGNSDTYLGNGIVGGSLLDFQALGKRLGEVGQRILAGEEPENIPSQTVPTVTMFDWRELRRWGISEQSLPAGSVVKFRQFGIWELYKWYIIALIGAIIIEAILIAALLFVRVRRRQAELENQRLAQVAEAEHQRLGEIVSNVPGIVWETRMDPATKERKTTFISDYLQKMLGYTPEEWLSAPPSLGLRIIPEEEREKVRQQSEAVIASGTDGVSQFRWQAKDGSFRWVENYLSPIKDPNNRVTGLRGVALDVTERKQTEQKNQAILQAIPDVMFVQSPEGVFLDYHAKDPASLLVAPEVFLGKNMRDVLPPDLAEEFAECFARTTEKGEPQIHEYKLIIDGAERWFEARMVRVSENILSVVRDITERKNSEAELRASEERFAKAFRANPQPMSITTVAEGRYVDVNDSFLAMSGYTREEVIGRTSLELMVWPNPPTRSDFIRRLQRCGSIVNTETIFYGKNGRVRTLLSSAEFMEISGENCLLMASSDVTERVQAQQALQESEARFRQMADTAPVMIWVADTNKLCTYVNQQFLNFTGRTMEQERGEGWSEGIHPDDYAQCLETYLSAFERSEPFHMEYRLRNAEGEYRWIFNTGRPRFSASGEFLGYIGSSVDIHDRKESEEELRTAHEEVNRLKNQLQQENIYLKEEINLQQNFGEIVGKSDALKYVLFKIEQVAPTETTVLITGETGTGKELVARAIHNASARRDRPLVKVNCAALSASLIESEFFGHEKGAFTGASTRKIGRFELANGATIFLDEIGELPLELQVKLLRVIQEGEFERLGSSKTIKVDVRIIAATNRHLDVDVKKGLFREDLWYRLNVFPITVPPLRQRREDIALLVEHFVGGFSQKLGKVITSVSPATLKSLQDYSWPGNVRELANVIERATIYSQGSVLRVGEEFGKSETPSTDASNKTLEELERDYIIRILNDTGWRIEGPHGAARILGINPSTLRTRMSKFGIHKPGQSFSEAAG